MADFGGGIYMALPVLVNRTYELMNLGNHRFTINGFAGLGYSFHHIFTGIEGVEIKNQHSIGIDFGLSSNLRVTQRWQINLRAGIFRSFTRPVEAYFAGTRVKSKNEFNYLVMPILIGVSRSIGRD